MNDPIDLQNYTIWTF